MFKTSNVFNILNTDFESGITYFINLETITKKDNTVIRCSKVKNFFERISEVHNLNLNFIVIIDEGYQNNTSKTNVIISSINAKYEIRVSVAPNKRVFDEFYEIPDVDVINEGLITRFMYINDELVIVEVENVTYETDTLFEKADEGRKKKAKAYIVENEEVRPFMLVLC